MARPAASTTCPPADTSPDLRPVEGDAADDELAMFATALGHPARVKILRLLIRRNSCVCGELVDELPHLRLCGLMCIAPNYDDTEKCRPLFRRMREIFDGIKDIPFQTANIKYLSMGMSHDYEIAIEEGANIVRVGTAIFGPRQY